MLLLQLSHLSLQLSLQMGVGPISGLRVGQGGKCHSGTSMREARCGCPAPSLTL